MRECGVNRGGRALRVFPVRVCASKPTHNGISVDGRESVGHDCDEGSWEGRACMVVTKAKRVTTALEKLPKPSWRVKKISMYACMHACMCLCISAYKYATEAVEKR
jgi:hypothetical protein